MNNVGIGSTAFANFVTPFSPVGKQAVGLENAERKEEPLPPVEESAESAETLNRRDEQEQRLEQEQREQRVEEREQQQQQALNQQKIGELAARDRDVRAHERAHSSVGGDLAGAPSFQYERGPDGVNYAVAGEVSISIGVASDDPEVALNNAEQVKRAALAPADPSAQDRQVAAQASQIIIDARGAVIEQQLQEQQAAEQERNARRTDEAEQRESELNEQQDQELTQQQQESRQQVNRRGARLSEQLIELGNIEQDQAAGAVVDRLA